MPSVREMKNALDAAGVSYFGITSKSELVAKYQRLPKNYGQVQKRKAAVGSTNTTTKMPSVRGGFGKELLKASLGMPPHGIHKPSGRVLFTPTTQWREVPNGAICPSGLEFKMDMSTGKNLARLLPRSLFARDLLPTHRPRQTAFRRSLDAR